MTSTVNKDWNAVITSAQQQIAEIDKQVDQLQASVEAQYGAQEKAAQSELNAIRAKEEAELAALRNQIPALRSQYAAISDQAARVTPTFEELTAARKASEADPNNTALKTAYQNILNQRNAALAPYNAQRDAIDKQIQALVTKQNQVQSTYAPQIAAAQNKLNSISSQYDAQVNQGIELGDKKIQLQQQIAEAQRQLSIQASGTTPANTNTISATTVPASATPGDPNVASTTDPSVQKLVDAPPVVDAQGNPTASSDPSVNTLLKAPPIAGVDQANLQAGLNQLTANAQANVATALAQPPALGLSANIGTAAGTAIAQDQAQLQSRADWRVRLALADGVKYLYNADNPGILEPLSAKKGTNGVIFPYTPTISVAYAAQYDPTNVAHSNYTVYQYSYSKVDQVTITCSFTAQDIAEAKYMLAVAHFFRSMTKMFYGQDADPLNGTPPPLCYLFGMGGWQFDGLPLAITGFNYSLPEDVDYIKTATPAPPNAPAPPVASKNSSNNRLGNKAEPGGTPAKPTYPQTPQQTQPITWVPTRMQMSVSCLPMMSRNQTSNYFSLKDYANGKLLEGTKRKGGAFW